MTKGHSGSGCYRVPRSDTLSAGNDAKCRIPVTVAIYDLEERRGVALLAGAAAFSAGYLDSYDLHVLVQLWPAPQGHNSLRSAIAPES